MTSVRPIIAETPGEGEVAAILKSAQPRLRAVLARTKIPPQDAEDLLQQTFLSFLQARAEICSPEAWLVGTLRKRCLLYWRERRRKLYEAVDSTFLEWLAQPEAPSQERTVLLDDLRRMIEQLHPRCRGILALRYQLGLEPKELAARLGYSPASVSKITIRCLAAVTGRLIRATPSLAEAPRSNGRPSSLK